MVIPFTNARILRNNQLCPVSICQKVSYSGGILVFSVTGFSNSIYSAEETPYVSPPTPTPPSGGGGTVTEEFVDEKADFNINKDLIKISLKQGESAREVVEVINIGDLGVRISLDAGILRNFMAISEDSFYLEQGGFKKINIDIFAKEDEIPGVYIGRIIVEGNGIKKTINVIIEIKSKKPLFDIKTELLDKIVSKGDNVRANITIVNMGDSMPIDIVLYYAVKDFENNILAYKEESLAIEDKLEITRTLGISENIPFGTYIFYLMVSYNNISAASSDTFEVSQIEKPLKIKKEYIVIIIVLAVVLIIIILFIVYKNFNKKKFKKQKTENNKPTVQEIIDLARKN